MSIISLITEYERKKLDRIGKARNDKKHPSWTRHKTDSFTDIEVERLGVYGEKGAGMYLGVEINEEIYTQHGDGGVDLIWNTIPIAVKYNHRWGGYLIVEPRDTDDLSQGYITELEGADLIIATHGFCNPPSRCNCKLPGDLYIVLAGWLTKTEFLSQMVSCDLGLGGRYICRKEQLHPMHSIWWVPEDMGFESALEFTKQGLESTIRREGIGSYG